MPQPDVVVSPGDVADATEPASDRPVPLSEVLAAAGAFDRPADADADADADVDARAAEARTAKASPRETRGSDRAGRRRSRDDRAAEKAASRLIKRDRIVEAPREPKTPLVQRLWPWGHHDEDRGPAGGPGASRRRIVSLLAGLVGAVGLVCSVVLAIGALLAALDATDSSVYDSVAGICDVLIGPLRDALAFTGAKADTKESLVAWGAGAIAYLVVGIVGQTLLRSAIDD